MSVSNLTRQEGSMIGVFIHGQARSGKSTLATALTRNGYRRFRFASTLKKMCKLLLSDAGYTPEESEYYIEGGGRLDELAYLGTSNITPRRMMQLLGTEFGRNLDENIWVNIVQNQIDAQSAPPVVDDMRFKNEWAMAFHRGYLLVKVVRADFVENEVTQSHASEQELSDDMFDVIIHNDSTYDDYITLLDRIVPQLVLLAATHQSRRAKHVHFSAREVGGR